MENLAGVIKFTSDTLAADEEKPYIPVFCDVSLKTLSEFMLDRWKMKVPDVMISIVTGVSYNKPWPEDYAVDFQAGLTKVMNTSHAWLLTHGFHTGIVKLLGEAVRDELDRRTAHKPRFVRRYNKRLSQITLIGICSDSLVNELEAFHGSDSSSGRRRVELDLGQDKPARQKYNLDIFHTHYVIVNGSTSKTITTFRTDLEKDLQRFSSCRKNFGAGATENSSEDEENHSVLPHRPTPDPSASKIGSGMGVPLVALLLQGGPPEIQQVWTYLKNRTPVVVVKGSGLVADIFAYLYEEVANSGDLETELKSITPEILKRLETEFPKLKQGSEEEKMDCCTKLLDCMRLDHQDGQHFITLLDLARAASDLADLDLYILRAIFGSQKTRELDWREQIKHDLVLTLQWNRPDFAREEIMRKSAVKIKVDKDIFRLALLMKNREDFVDLILQQGFKVHKFLSHRALIDLFCHAEDTEFFSVNVLGNLLGYIPGTVVGERFVLEDLNWIITTFTRVEQFTNAYELSTNACGIYSTEPGVAERKALNVLIVWSILMGRHKLTEIIWKYVEDPITTAIFVSAMWNGLSRFCREPEQENQVRAWGKDFGAMGMEVLNMAYKESLDRAFDLLDREFPDFGRRTPVQLAYDAKNRWFLAHPCCQKWINRLYMGNIVIASDHPGALHIPEFLKILLSAFFVFPMFFWIHFPSLDTVEARRAAARKRSTKATAIKIYPDEESNQSNKAVRPRSLGSEPESYERISLLGTSKVHFENENSKASWLMELQENQQKAQKTEKQRRILRRLFFGAITGGEPQFSLGERVHLLWTAPVTKFWTFQFFYWCYLILFSVVTLMPVCHHLDVSRPRYSETGLMSGLRFDVEESVPNQISTIDIVLWIWTALLTAEAFYQNYNLVYSRHVSHALAKILEMACMLGFLAAYFMVRVLSLQPKMVNAYTAKVLMCCGLLYFCYRLIGIFFPISDTLGPMLVRIKYMVGSDFLNYLKMILPFMLAGGVTVQAIMYPDLPLTWEIARLTFHKAFFSLFLAQPIVDLQYTKDCEQTRLNDTMSDTYCIAGDYQNKNCVTVGWWAYFIVIQFMVMLKLILATLLYALFTATQLRIEADADSIWKFKRYSVVMEFVNRATVPPPFSLLHYMYFGVRWVIREFKKECGHRESHKNDLLRLRGRRSYRHDDFHYWKGLVREYFRQRDRQTREAEITQRSLDKLVQINEILKHQTASLRHVKERLGEVEAVVASLTKTTTDLSRTVHSQQLPPSSTNP